MAPPPGLQQGSDQLMVVAKTNLVRVAASIGHRFSLLDQLLNLRQDQWGHGLLLQVFGLVSNGLKPQHILLKLL